MNLTLLLLLLLLLSLLSLSLKKKLKIKKNLITTLCVIAVKKSKDLRDLRAHQRSCVASNLDDLKALFTQSNATNRQQTNDTDDERPLPQQEKVPVKDEIKPPTTKEEWETVNMCFHTKSDLHSDITDIENEVCVFQSCFMIILN